MANLNKVMLIGRLTADPEIRYTASSMPIANMRMAVNRFRKGADGNRIEEAVYIDVSAYGKTAELAQKWLKKGRQIYLDGQLRFEQWDDKTSGQKRSKLSVDIDTIQFLDSGGRPDGQREGGDGSEESGGSGPGFGGPGPAGGYRNARPPQGDDRPSDDDVPF